VRDSLAGRLRRRPRPAALRPPADEPPVEELLDVDREYRDKAGAQRLHLLAPRRFNPRREAWLPVLHTRRGPRQYSALYSNTALAHRQGKTRDWVVIYRDDDGGRQQWTAVTFPSGPLRGRRVIRGREQESARYYETHPDQAEAPRPAGRSSP
jgi:DNA polymerase (family X)